MDVRLHPECSTSPSSPETNTKQDNSCKPEDAENGPQKKRCCQRRDSRFAEEFALHPRGNRKTAHDLRERKSAFSLRDQYIGAVVVRTPDANFIRARRDFRFKNRSCEI